MAGPSVQEIVAFIVGASEARGEAPVGVRLSGAASEVDALAAGVRMGLRTQLGRDVEVTARHHRGAVRVVALEWERASVIGASGPDSLRTKRLTTG